MIDVLITYEPPALKAQEVTSVSLTPVSSEVGSEPLALEEVHTKDVHLIIVSEDLSFFAHEHPQKRGKGYAADFSFPFGGQFLLYSDIKPLNGSPVTIRKTVEVAGAQKPPQRYPREVLSASHKDVSVHLEVSLPNAIKVHIYQNGAAVPASSLGDFLGAKAHVVMIPLMSKTYLHVHPAVHQEELVLHTLFAVKGTYRAWLQMLLQERLYTFDFVLLVENLPTGGHHH